MSEMEEQGEVSNVRVLFSLWMTTQLLRVFVFFSQEFPAQPQTTLTSSSCTQ
jgi:hypothetical protein